MEIELSQNDVKALMRQTMGLPLMNEQVDGGDPDARAAALVRGLQPLGLQLKGRKVPVEMIVVDGFEKTPGEN